jgi:predicted kinase
MVGEGRGKAKLYVLIGVQGSGKSTWARANAGRLGAEVVASDEVRNELEAAGVPAAGEGDRVFATLEARVGEHLARGCNVIADATHVKRRWREQVVALAREHGARRVAVWFDLPLEVCLERNARKPGGEWGDRPAPEEVVRALWWGLEAPGGEEFEEVVRVGA